MKSERAHDVEKEALRKRGGRVRGHTHMFDVEVERDVLGVGGNKWGGGGELRDGWAWINQN